MAIYHCPHCGLLAESTETVGNTSSCANCKQEVSIQDTILFVQSVMNKYSELSNKIKLLQENFIPLDTANTQIQAALNSSDLFANPKQHDKIKHYLNRKNLTVSFNYAAVDMSGYFDEAAELIGDNFPLLEKYLKQIRFLYANNKVSLMIDCVNLPQKENQKLQNIFKKLFSYTILSKYNYQASEKKIRISLNTTNSVKKFLTGGWLEWFATIKLIKEAHAKEKTFSIARSVVVQHENGDKNEFDVVFMTEHKTPLFIECKSGEFRQDLDKFIRICKKINIPTKNWIVLASEIDKPQADAFEKMYPVRFCDLMHFLEKVKPLI
ncbi:MAG: DUF1887 family protein [Neisseriaceae bacterium]|nr:DUF1887 family protein [Neisseriaceae bacterium]